MKNQRIKIVTAVAVVLSLLLSMNVAWAATRADGSPYTVGTCTASFVATSSTKALAEVMGSSTGLTPFITSKITLQSAPLGSSSYSNVSGVSPDTYTIYDDTVIYHIANFPITSSKNYRIKIELTDQVGSGKITTTYYEKLSR